MALAGGRTWLARIKAKHLAEQAIAAEAELQATKGSIVRPHPPPESAPAPAPAPAQGRLLHWDSP